MFCASNQVKCLASDRKCVFCSYRNRNEQLSRRKALFRAWIRRKCCVKPLANEFNGLMHLNSCLFKIPRSNIYINLKETDVSIIFVSRETLFLWSVWILPLFHVKQKRWGILDNKTSEVSRETNLSNSIFFNKTERNKGFFWQETKYASRFWELNCRKEEKTLKIKRNWRQAAKILLEKDFLIIFISFFFVKMPWFYK